MWDEKKLLDRINDRLSELEQKYYSFQDSRDTITELFRPDLGIDTEDGKDGTFFGSDIYEGTAPWAARVAATGFQGNLVSQSIDWFMYLMSASELRGIDQLDTWCQDVKDHMTAVYRKSNFYETQPQFTLNGLTIGSPVMFGEEEILEGRIMWLPQHYKHVFMSYDKYNRPNGIIIKDDTWTAKQIYDTFINQQQTPEARKAERKKKLSTILNNSLESGRLSDTFTIIRAVFKVDDQIWGNGGFEKPDGDYSWISVYFEDSNEKDKDTPLKSGGYYSKPFANWDYDKKPWESCSRTPAFDAVYDVQSHQQIHKNFIENVQLKNRPPRYALAALENRLQLSAEGITFVDNTEYDRPPKALDLIGDVQINKELSDIFSEAIKRHFHLDLFQLFTSVAMGRKQPLTATQIWQMAGEKATLLSPAVETHSKYLKAIDDRCVDIESRAGRGPFAPDIMGNVMDIVFSNSKEPVRSIGLTPEFVGPLARAQRMQQALDTIQMGLSAAAPLFQLYPDLRVALKEYDVLDDVLKATGFPLKDLKTKEDYEAMLDAINQQRAQQAQTENAIEMAKASKSLQGPVDPSSILAGVGRMAGAA